MKSTITISALVATTLMLWWCTMPWASTTSPDTTTLSWSTTTTMTTEQPSLAECKKVVDEYLATTKTYTVDSSQKVSSWSAIVVDYVGRLADGSVFDTSVESVAKWCGLYTSQRDYKTWLPFVAGAWQMIAWFDKAVVGMSVNETTTVTIPAAQAYGEATVAIPREQLPTKSDGTQYTAGENIMTMNGSITIESINDKEFTIKNVLPLAGKDLIFDITIKSVK